MSYNDIFQIDATLVANEFLDKYMPSANGDYVKVYLYLLRNRINGVDVETVADHLELTEGDVRRAIKYWEKCGIVSVGPAGDGKKGAEAEAAGDGSDAAFGTAEAKSVGNADTETSGTGRAGAKRGASSRSSAAGAAGAAGAASSRSGAAGTASSRSGAAGTGTAGAASVNAAAAGTPSVPEQTDGRSAAARLEADESGEIRRRYRSTDGKEALNRLAEDDEFRQLLVIVQNYRSKILTETEQQVVAYLYDGLKMPADVLDYLVQYCVENKHNNMRYIEKTGLDWVSSGIKTVRAAKKRTKDFEKLKEGAASKKAVSRDKAGITRNNDLDQWLNKEVRRSIQ